MYQIRDRRNPLCLFATGFDSLAKAEAWIADQRDMMANGRHIWVDKTLTADDFVIREV